MGLSQSELARRSRVRLHELRKLERGLADPSVDVLERLARELKCDLNRLRAAHRAYSQSVVPGEGYTTRKVGATRVLERRLEPSSGMIKVLDVFCGAGGFSYGFEGTGHYEVTGAIDLLDDRVETFAANHPHATTVQADIRKFAVEDLGRLALAPQVLVGGPPCQGFSSLRPFRQLTEGDARNNLLEDFLLVVGTLRPEWFVFENVVGLLTHRGGQALDSLLSGFRDIGYRTERAVLNCALFGLPQHRERLVIVGTRTSGRFKWPEPTHHVEHRSMAGSKVPRILSHPLLQGELNPAVTVMGAIHDLPPLKAGESADWYLDVIPSEYEREMRNGAGKRLALHEATNHSAEMLEIVKRAGTNRFHLPEGMTTSGFSSCYSRLHADRPSTTITVNFVHPSSNRCIHPQQDRALTPREGARLQSFPDRFTFCGTRAEVVKQIGNAVPPLLGQVIATALYRAIC